MGNMVANEYGIPFAKFLHKRLHISKNLQFSCQLYQNKVSTIKVLKY